MGVTLRSDALDFLPTYDQRVRRDFRQLARQWLVAGMVGVALLAAPAGWDWRRLNEQRSRLALMQAAQARLHGDALVHETLRSALTRMRNHRRAALSVDAMRWSAPARVLDVMRACSDGTRLTTLEATAGALRIEGYATTQSRVREMQKRLRALPWVRKVAEVESSMVPAAVAQALVGDVAVADGASRRRATPATLRRFTLRVDPRALVARAADGLMPAVVHVNPFAAQGDDAAGSGAR